LKASEQIVTDVITIDGPAGAGKSTVARRVAKALDYAYLDTGAMYRAATWWALRQEVPLDEPDALVRATEALPLEMLEEGSGLVIRVAGEDVTEAIRHLDVTRHIRYLDGLRGVRSHLTALQRDFARSHPCVVEGRDMGTVVFPQARCKIFLDAALDTRVERRLRELESRGVSVRSDDLADEIRLRDENDRTRETAPLKPAEDALIIDGTSLSLDEVVSRILAYHEECSK